MTPSYLIARCKVGGLFLFCFFELGFISKALQGMGITGLSRSWVRYYDNVLKF